MKSLYEDLISKLSACEFSYPLHVYGAYTVEKPTYPALMIDETINREHVSVGGKERVTLLAYRFDLLCGDEWDEQRQQAVSRRQVAHYLAAELDAIIRDRWGFTRTGDPVYMVSGEPAIGRYILTYQGYVSEDDYIYRQGV